MVRHRENPDTLQTSFTRHPRRNLRSGEFVATILQTATQSLSSLSYDETMDGKQSSSLEQAQAIPSARFNAARNGLEKLARIPFITADGRQSFHRCNLFFDQARHLQARHLSIERKVVFSVLGLSRGHQSMRLCDSRDIIT
jgi:hypothetical protein